MRVTNTVIVLLLLITTISPIVAAEPVRVISNSNNWADVYSSLLYANLNNIESDFLVSTGHSTLLLYGINKGEEIQVVSSNDDRYIVGYDEILRSQGYPEESEELVLDNINLELAERLTNINKFIVMDDAYGYNALSAAPYAAVDNYYVLFANDRNIGRIVNFLEDKNVEDLIIFGTVDRNVRDELAIFNPEIINAGDRFDNNFEMVKKYLEVKPTKQAILTSGEFIEKSMMSGFDPVIFIGRTNVPDKVKAYIDETGIDIGILIGNELVSAATTIRRQVGISVFVKFAQGARRPTGAVAQVEDLDRFPMPSFNLNVDIDSVDYNTATGNLEVTYRNNVAIGAYLRGTITVRDGAQIKTLADEESFFIDGGEFKTIIYDSLTNGNSFTIDDDQATAQIFALFGEAPNALEYQLEKSLEISFIDVLDDSNLEIKSVEYNKALNRFEITVENIGEVDLYANGEIYDLIVNDEEGTYASGDTVSLSPGKSGVLHVNVEMIEADFLDNTAIFSRVFYGERSSALIKVATAENPLVFTSANVVVIIVIVIIILLILLLLFIKKKCKHCKTKNALYKTKCKKCKQRL